MSRTTHRVGAVLLLLVLLATAACSAGPSNRPAVAYRDAEQQVAPGPQAAKPAPLPPLGSPGNDALKWEDCTELVRRGLTPTPSKATLTYSCSKLLTTLDSPESPARGVSRMSLLSTGSGAIPLVVTNDAGGEPGTLFAARLAQQLPEEVLRTFKIIGVDRRGTGQSEAADCIPPEERDAVIGFDPRATDRASLDRLLDSVRESSQQCLLHLDERLQAYDTWRASSDLEELRLELGVPKLHAIGRGEAARLLTTYAERYPNSVGRMVLDGAPDPFLDAMGQAETQAQSAEQTFDTFASDCISRGSCPLGTNPRKTVSELIDRTRLASPPGTPNPPSAGKIVNAMMIGLADRNTWPELARSLEAANRGDAAALTALVEPLIIGDPIKPARLDADMITSCNDTTLRIPPQRSAQIAADWVGKFPLFGGTHAQRLLWCGLWPVPQQQLPTPKNPGLPPIPVISTAHDPLAPALGTEHMADQLPSGVRLSWQGAGHGAIGRSTCITATISRFFLHGAVPTDGTACPA